MYKTAIKYNICLAPLSLTTPVKLQLPAWFHPGGSYTSYPNEKNVSSCLAMKHNITTVQDMFTLSQTPLPTEHYDNMFCPCDPCTYARNNGCGYPARCQQAACDFILSLPPLWNPTLPSIGDQNPGKPNPTDDAPAIPPDACYFNPDITTRTLNEAFRVFVPTDPVLPIQQFRLPAPPYPPGYTRVFTDGSYSFNSDGNATAGSGIWYGANDPRNAAIKVPTDLLPSNNVAELVAILAAVQTFP
ncbi:hypothetical protein JOM56_005448, partial [Amanita muscaria]